MKGCLNRSYPLCSLARSQASWSCSAVLPLCRRSRCTWPALCPPAEAPCTAASPPCWAASWLMLPCLLLWSTWAQRTGGYKHHESAHSQYDVQQKNPRSTTQLANQSRSAVTALSMLRRLFPEKPFHNTVQTPPAAPACRHGDSTRELLNHNTYEWRRVRNKRN